VAGVTNTWNACPIAIDVSLAVIVKIG